MYLIVQAHKDKYDRLIDVMATKNDICKNIQEINQIMLDNIFSICDREKLMDEIYETKYNSTNKNKQEFYDKLNEDDDYFKEMIFEYIKSDKLFKDIKNKAGTDLEIDFYNGYTNSFSYCDYDYEAETYSVIEI